MALRSPPNIDHGSIGTLFTTDMTSGSGVKLTIDEDHDEIMGRTIAGLGCCMTATVFGSPLEPTVENAKIIARAMRGLQCSDDITELIEYILEIRGQRYYHYRQPTEIETKTYPVETLDELELEENVILSFPPARKYAVDLTITKITKPKLRLVVTEDLL